MASGRESWRKVESRGRSHTSVLTRFRLLLKAWRASFRRCSTFLSAFFGTFVERGRPALRSLRFEG